MSKKERKFKVGDKVKLANQDHPDIGKIIELRTQKSVFLKWEYNPSNLIHGLWNEDGLELLSSDIQPDLTKSKGEDLPGQIMTGDDFLDKIAQGAYSRIFTLGGDMFKEDENKSVLLNDEKETEELAKQVQYDLSKVNQFTGVMKVFAMLEESDVH